MKALAENIFRQFKKDPSLVIMEFFALPAIIEGAIKHYILFRQSNKILVSRELMTEINNVSV